MSMAQDLSSQLFQEPVLTAEEALDLAAVMERCSTHAQQPEQLIHELATAVLEATGGVLATLSLVALGQMGPSRVVQHTLAGEDPMPAQAKRMAQDLGTLTRHPLFPGLRSSRRPVVALHADRDFADAWHRQDYRRDLLTSIGLADCAVGWVRSRDRSMLLFAGTYGAADGPSLRQGSSTCLRLLLASFGGLMVEQLESPMDERIQSLTPRQQEVLGMLLDGLCEKEVAAAIEVSPHTVHNHVKRLHEQFQVNSRAELLSLFIQKPASLVGLNAYHMASTPAFQPAWLSGRRL
ncbi:response regulator transcription factor [Mucisphaera sp.]|uniref:helix-turn-helix transcriptional regulator n=1 Tax=Mucisphaera sp. TaxID=2913024 RepID=UPI003D0BF569